MSPRRRVFKRRVRALPRRVRYALVLASELPDPRHRPGACRECGRLERPHVRGCPLDPSVKDVRAA